MTLIQSIHYGGAMSVMTSDTRQVYKSFGKTKIMKNDKSKISRISPYCIFGGGGTNKIVDAIRDHLTSNSISNVFLSEYVIPLNRAVKEVQLQYIEEFKNEETAQIMISGFNEDGSSGLITFITGTDQEVKYIQLEDSEELFNFISPSEDESEAVFQSVKRMPVERVEDLTEASIGYLANIQNAFYMNDPKTVSEIFCYCAIYRDPNTGEFQFFEDKIRLN